MVYAYACVCIKLKMLLDISELNLTIYHNVSGFTLYLLEKCDSGHGEKARLSCSKLPYEEVHSEKRQEEER